jgi:hypothetical protein
MATILAYTLLSWSVAHEKKIQIRSRVLMTKTQHSWFYPNGAHIQAQMTLLDERGRLLSVLSLAFPCAIHNPDVKGVVT